MPRSQLGVDTYHGTDLVLVADHREQGNILPGHSMLDAGSRHKYHCPAIILHARKPISYRYVLTIIHRSTVMVQNSATLRQRYLSGRRMHQHCISVLRHDTEFAIGTIEAVYRILFDLFEHLHRRIHLIHASGDY